MGKTIRKQFGIKFIEGNRKAHKKLKYICRCEYCMGLRKRKLQIKEKLKEIKKYLDTQLIWLEHLTDTQEVLSSNLSVSTNPI